METTQKVLLAGCKRYHMAAILGQNVRAKFLFCVIIHMVGLTVIEDVSKLCFASTATTARRFKKPCTEYNDVRTFDDDDT